MSTLPHRIAHWANRNMPKREELEHNRWVGPFARRPELWRFTRRSVPRGVAVGLLVGPMFVVGEALFALGWGGGLLAEIERQAGPTHLRDLTRPAA